jgi:hypothetical protein
MCRKLLLGLMLLSLIAPQAVRAEEDESVAERRERVEHMTPEQKAELKQKQERFANLSPAEQERIRKLHEEINGCKDKDKLKNTLERYHHWLATLSSGERNELLSLPQDKRIAKIKELMDKQEDQRFKTLVAAKLTKEDREAIVHWLGDYVDEHHDEIMESLPEEWRPRGEGDAVRFPLMGVMARRWSTEENAKGPRPTKADFDKLTASLSDDARKTIEGVKEADKRDKLALKWVGAAIWSRRAPPPVSPEELNKFYVNLSPTEREKLDTLPPQEMQASLLRIYHQHHFPGRGGPWQGGRGGGPGGQRGGGRGGDGERGPGRGDGGRGRDKEPPQPPA